MALVGSVYRASGSWPREEQYGLTNQTRRAAVSVPANIAEGQGRTGSKELIHHLSIAQGSLAELETLILIAQDLHYLNDADCDTLLARATEVSRLIGGLIRSLRQPPP
jgi:four helix bundle protein